METLNKPQIKFLKKGLKIEGKYFPCWYSSSKNNINGNATIYLRDYGRLPDVAYQIFKVENDTDMQTDYFEKDRLRIAPNSPFFQTVEALAKR